jgi:hypothetical protein
MDPDPAKAWIQIRIQQNIRIRIQGIRIQNTDFKGAARADGIIP